MKTTTPEVNKDNADAHGVACSVCGLAYEQGHTYAYKDTVFIWKNYNCTACGYVDNSDTIGTCPGTHRYRLISYTDDQHTLGCTYADCTTQTSAAHSWDAGTDVTPEGSFYTVVKYTCDAGCVKYDYTKIETHVCTWQYSGSTATTHTQTCAECGETKTENHTFTTSWTSGNAVYHDLTCACGFSKQQVHSWTKGTLQYHCDYCDAAGLEGQLHDCDTNGHSCFVDSYTDDQHTLACHDPTCTYTVTEGHTWDAGKVLQEATMTQYGITRYTCTGGCVKDVYSAKLDHAHNWTIEDLGNNQYKKTCSVCNTVVTWYGYPIEEHYQAAGTYDVSMKSYTYTDNGNGVTECRFYYPYELTNSDATWPVIVMCNGSGSGFGAGDAENYVALFNLLASWGFIVIANNDENSGTGDSAEFTLDLLLSENQNASSIFYGKVNTDAVGVWGHSQGGAGAINAASVRTNSSYYKAVFLASISEAGRSEGVGFAYAGNIQTIANIPCMMISGANGFFELTVAGGPEALITNYPKFNNAVAGIREDLEHGHTILGAKGYVVAWFRYTLMGDTYAAQAFHGSNAEFLKNEYWQGIYDAENEGVVYQWLNGAQIKNTSHIMGEYVSNNDSNCTSVGTKTASCQIAGCTKSETIAESGTAPGHAYDNGIVTTAPTCEGEGIKTFTCATCGDTYTEEIPAEGHTPAAAVRENEEAATCYAEGSYDEVIYCSVESCHKELSRETKSIDEIEHTPADAVEENRVEATCGASGSYDSVVYCSVEACHAEISRTTETLAATGAHIYSSEVTKEPGCETKGVKTFTCATCGDSYTEEIPAEGHTPAAAVRENEEAATCTVDGSYDSVVYCSVCEEELSRETTTVAAVGHSYDAGEITTAPTCTAAGIKTFTCASCGDTYTEEIPAKGHDTELTYDYEGSNVTVQISDVETLEVSTFATKMNAETLMAKIDFCANFAADSEYFDKVIENSDFAEFAKGILGDEFAAAEENVLTRLFVFYVAKAAENWNADAMVSFVNGTGEGEQITSALGEVDTAHDGLVKAAMAYGMYVAYAYDSGDETLIENTNTASGVHNNLDDDAFHAWLAEDSAKTDATGYLAALKMIRENMDNEIVRNHVLSNGFNNTTLVDVIEKAFEDTNHTCSCGETDISECVWTEATCTKPKTCLICGKTNGEALEHTYGEWSDNGDGTQSKTCSGCGDVVTEDVPVVLNPVVDKTGTVTPATITAPADGWKLGTNTFSVMCDKACVVLFTEDGETYTRLNATAVMEGETIQRYNFTIENLTDKTEIVVCLLGDVNGDGKVNSRDESTITCALLYEGHTRRVELSALNMLIADVNLDGKFNSRDESTMTCSLLYEGHARKTVLSWIKK